LQDHDFEGTGKEIAAVRVSGHVRIVALNTYFVNRYMKTGSRTERESRNAGTRGLSLIQIERGWADLSAALEKSMVHFSECAFSSY
jgi:hypothetical protein